MANKFDKKIANSTIEKKKKSYSYKSLTCDYLILYPLMILVYWIERAKEKDWNIIKWNEKRSIRIIDRYLLKSAKVDKEKSSLYLWVRDWGFFWKDHCRLWDKRYCDKFNYEMKKYFIEEYQIEGYDKTTEKENEWTYVEFKKKT